MDIILLLVGLILGGVAGWFVARSKFSSVTAERDLLRGNLEETKVALEKSRGKIIELTDALAATEADYRNLQEKLGDQKKEFKDLQETFTAQFKNLANEIFEEKSRKFTEQNKNNIFDLLNPLGERITEFEKKIEQAHKDAIEKNAGLFNELKNLRDLNAQMSEEAKNLTRALKGDTRAQGSWGELVLESILNSSGLERDREYVVQESFKSPEGRTLRPDVIVKLPSDKHVIIDSKVSLKAYDNFMNCDSEEERQVFLKAHIQSVRQHLRLLQDKNYAHHFSDNGLDFVIMFIPIEPAYLLTIQNETGIYEEALEKRIMMVSPTLLIPCLKLIKSAWNQEYQSRHVIDIANKAGALYDKFVSFSDDLIALGRHLDTSKKYYEESMKKLSVGSGNLVRKVEDLKRLGAKASKTIDPKLLGRSEEQKDLFD